MVRRLCASRVNDDLTRWASSLNRGSAPGGQRTSAKQILLLSTLRAPSCKRSRVEQGSGSGSGSDEKHEEPKTSRGTGGGNKPATGLGSALFHSDDIAEPN